MQLPRSDIQRRFVQHAQGQPGRGLHEHGTGFTFRANAFFNYSDNDYKVYAPIVDLSTGRSLGDAWVKRFNDAYYSAGLKMETGVIAKPWADQLLVGVILSGNDKHIQTGATMDAVYGRVKSRSYSLIPTYATRRQTSSRRDST